MNELERNSKEEVKNILCLFKEGELNTNEAYRFLTDIFTKNGLGE